VAEVPVIHEPVGDALEDAQLAVGALQTSAGDSVRLVEGEDLVSPLQEDIDHPLELGEGLLLIGGDEGPKASLAFRSPSARVDPIEVLEAPPGRLELGIGAEDLPQPGRPLVRESVPARRLQVARAGHLGIQGRGGAGGPPLALDAPPGLVEPRAEPGGHVKAVHHVGGPGKGGPRMAAR
jgi:hypothetical protein